MPEIVVRPYEDRDRERYFHVRAMTWNNGRPIPVEEQYFRTTQGYSAEVDGELGGVFAVLDMTCTRGKSILKCAGIAGVAVLPELRQHGIGGAMMRWALQRLKSEGFQMASLYAFRDSYYRKFGYATTGSRYLITLPNNRFPKLEHQLPISIVAPEQYASIKHVYEQFAQNRSGMNMRTPLQWERVVGKGHDSTIYAAGDPAEAYLVIRHKGDFWQPQDVSELIWSSKRGYDTILSLLTGIGINKSSVKWNEPADSPFLAQHYDQGVEVSWERPIMFRVLDVKACLEKLQPQHAGAFCIRIKDELMPENRGPWRVSFGSGGVEVSACEDADFELDSRQFTQAVLGQPNLLDLANNGLVSVKNSEGFQKATHLLTPMSTYCADFF